MVPKVFSRVTGPVSSAIGLVKNVGSTGLNSVKSVWKSLGNGSSKVVRNIGSRGNNALKKVVTGRGGRRSMTRKMNMKKSRKNRR